MLRQIIASILVPLVFLWGCGLVISVHRHHGAAGPYFQRTGHMIRRFFRRVLGWLQGLLGWLLEILMEFARYIWRRWRAELVWFLVGAASVTWCLWYFGTPW